MASVLAASLTAMNQGYMASALAASLTVMNPVARNAA